MRLFLAIALASISQTVLGHSKGAVASEASACSRIGVNLIKDGGNAADAVSRFQIFHALLIFSVGRNSLLRWSDWYVIVSYTYPC